MCHRKNVGAFAVVHGTGVPVLDDHADYRHTLREFLTDGYTQNE